MAYRVSLLFDVTTAPSDLTAASPHSGGWSESHWTLSVTDLTTNFLPLLAQRRAALLSSLSSIIGFRVENFTISGNKLLPGGTTSGRFLYPGGFGGTLNLPQDALQISIPAQSAPNVSRSNLRGMPDTVVALGEYQPTTGYKTAVASFLQTLNNGGWGFVGRVKSNPSARVNNIAAGVVTLSANVGGVAGTSYLRMNRVYDTLNNPIRGAYLITAIAANVYTLQGFPSQNVTTPSGSARVDALQYFGYSIGVPVRAVSRKIGRPFEQYRGRASRRRA
jgi:hypothetical protein